MTSLSPDTISEVQAVLAELNVATLPPSTWEKVPGQLKQLRRSLSSADEHEVRAALVPLSRAAFEAKVGSRLGPRRAGANIVIPTKSTPALPIVGLICGAALLFLGWQLGGGLMLAATAALALLVFGVALAGTHANAERAAERQARTEPETVQPAAIPSAVHTAIKALQDTPSLN